MTNEELILEKLEKLEAQIQPLISTSEKITELKNDLVPLSNQAVGLMIEQLSELEGGFQLEDLTALTKEALRNTRNFNYLLKQMSSIIEFIQDMEPLLKSAVPQAITLLDEMERKGVFRIVRATVDLRKKVAAANTAEDIEVMGDGIVAVLGLFKSLSDPRAIALLERLSKVPADTHLDKIRPTGVFGLASAGFDPEVSRGIGVVLELARALGRAVPPAEQV